MIGVDEAGRGALAGPVVAAAVVLPDGIVLPHLIRDSKALSHAQRELIWDWIYAHAVAVGVGMCSAKTIDRINILQATMLAMTRAVLAVSELSLPVVIDGNRVPLPLRDRATSQIKGDALVPAISAASIVAKVTRDRIMCALDRKFPVYGFAVHKGYGTAIHLEALRRHGPCRCHRFGFAPVSTVGLWE